MSVVMPIMDDGKSITAFSSTNMQRRLPEQSANVTENTTVSEDALI
jgi:hypothetical protein